MMARRSLTIKQAGRRDLCGKAAGEMIASAVCTAPRGIRRYQDTHLAGLASLGEVRNELRVDEP
jgi:hypothetical protein